MLGGATDDGPFFAFFSFFFILFYSFHESSRHQYEEHSRINVQVCAFLDRLTFSKTMTTCSVEAFLNV